MCGGYTGFYLTPELPHFFLRRLLAEMEGKVLAHDLPWVRVVLLVMYLIGLLSLFAAGHLFPKRGGRRSVVSNLAYLPFEFGVLFVTYLKSLPKNLHFDVL